MQAQKQMYTIKKWIAFLSLFLKKGILFWSKLVSDVIDSEIMKDCKRCRFGVLLTKIWRYDAINFGIILKMVFVVSRYDDDFGGSFFDKMQRVAWRAWRISLNWINS